MSPKLTPAGWLGNTWDTKLLMTPEEETLAPDAQIPPLLQYVSHTLPGTPLAPGPTVTVGWSPTRAGVTAGSTMAGPVPYGA